MIYEVSDKKSKKEPVRISLQELDEGKYEVEIGGTTVHVDAVPRRPPGAVRRRRGAAASRRPTRLGSEYPASVRIPDQKDELWKIIWHAKRWSEDESLVGEWYEGWEGVPEARDYRVVADIIVNVQTGTGNRIEFFDATGVPMSSKAKIRRYIDTGRLTMGR